jgi:hypothetical protein
MTFNPSIAYLGDWQYRDPQFIENGDYYPPGTGNQQTESAAVKMERDRKTVSRMFGRPITFNATSEALVVWHPTNSAGKLLPFKPEVRGKFVLQDGSWIIDEFTKDEFGVYAFRVTKARENVRPA